MALMLSHDHISQLFLMRKNAIPINKSSLCTVAWVITTPQWDSYQMGTAVICRLWCSQSGFSDGCMTGGEGSAY